MSQPLTQTRPLWHGRTLAFVGILLVAFNLRTLPGSLSPIFGVISEDFAVPTMAIAVLGATAPICFAIASLVTPRIGRKIGLEYGLLLALLLILVGQIIRIASGHWIFLVLGTAIALFGTGMGNVLLPPTIKKYFPDRIGLLTMLYVAVMAIASSTPPIVGYPLSEAVGWRTGLGTWAVATVIAFIPWLFELRRAKPAQQEAEMDALSAGARLNLWRSPTAIAIAITLAVSSINGYVTNAWFPLVATQYAHATPTQAGIYLGLFSLMGLPMALLIPGLAAKFRKRTAIIVLFSFAFFIVGYGGLLLFPTSATWLWSCIIGLGPLIFPLTLALMNLRTRSTSASLQLSGFSQLWAYAAAAVSPILVGFMHSWTGGWTAYIFFMLAVSFPLLYTAVVLARGNYVEDEVA